MGETESTGGFEFAKPQDETSEWGGHPLFPRAETETGPDRRKFDIIHIQRYKSDGSREVCPKAWRGADLRSWEQVVEAYGGGTYQLVSQCSRTFRYQAFSDKVYFGGPSKPFGEAIQSETRAPLHEMPSEPAPVAVSQHAPAPPPAHVMAAPMASAPILQQYAQPAPYPYPYPPPAPPPAASGNSETLALVRAVIESSNSEKTALMRALLERSGGKETGSLEVVREILPLMNGGANGTQALLQGVELARGLIGPGNMAPAPAPAPARAEDDLALLGQVLRMIAPAAVVTAATPAAPAAPSAPPPATMTPPPGGAPPGWAWAYTMTGWVLVQLAHVQPYPVQTPVSAPMPQAAQPAAKPNESSSSPQNANPLAGIEEVLSDPEMGQLFASLSKMKGVA